MRRPIWLVLILILVTVAIPFIAQTKLSPSTSSASTAQTINDFVVTYKWWIMAPLISINVIITSWSGFFAEPRAKQRRIRESILEDMRFELFDDEKTDLRITIFRKANWWTARIIWCRILLMTCRRRLMRQKKSTRMKVGKVFRYRFVHITQRLGTEFNNSRTFFHYNPATKADCESVAAHVMQTGEVVTKRDLPDMREHAITTSSSSELHPYIKIYLRETYATLATLKRLHVTAIHFHAVPLVSPKTSARIGVLVIDSVQTRCPFEDSGIRKRIGDYATMLNRTL